MAVFAVSITKRINWRGSNQEFSNVYHYKTGLMEPFPDTTIINKVADAERPIHGGQVEFVRGRTWGPTEGTQENNKMREVVQLSGNGTGPDQSGFYRELAIMVYWPLGRYGSRNRPQYLRKWLHTQNPMSTVTDYVEGNVRDTTIPAALQTYIDRVSNVNAYLVITDVELCTKTGRTPIGAAQRYPYLEHRQLGR